MTSSSGHTRSFRRRVRLCAATFSIRPSPRTACPRSRTRARAAAHLAVLADRAGRRVRRAARAARGAARARAIGWCAFAATLIFVALPFGYDNGDLQLATGPRFALRPRDRTWRIAARSSGTAAPRTSRPCCFCCPRSLERRSSFRSSQTIRRRSSAWRSPRSRSSSRRSATRQTRWLVTTAVAAILSLRAPRAAKCRVLL